MRIKVKNRTRLVDAAAGRIPCDLLIINANMVNVFTGEVYKADVGIYNGFIAHIHCDPDGLGREEKELVGNECYDAKGAYLIPGLIDSHIHVESTMMTPRYFTEAVVPYGTTTVITDPHEIGNVLGIKGVKYMHDCTERLPMRHLILAPSCVPSVPGKESGGAEFGVAEIEELMRLERVIGLAEVMDFPGVINNSPRMVGIVGRCFDKEKFIQGHAFYTNGRELSAYACAGPQSDHESNNAQVARDRVRIGINVDARESSISQDVTNIIFGTKGFRYFDNITFATDDTESHDIIRRGHVNFLVRRAIQAGIDPIDAIKIGTINAAREVGIKNLGAIAPGYVADLIITDDIARLLPRAVFFEGKLVAENGKLVNDIEDVHYEIEKINTVNLWDVEAENLKIKAPISDGKIMCNVIKFDPKKSLMTEFVQEKIPVKRGYIDISHDRDLKYVAVINRYGKRTMSCAIARNFGIKTGAMGSTVAHDCHNVVIIYDTPDNALLLLNDLKATGGGYVCAQQGEILERLELPVAGLMANKPIEIVANQSKKFKEALEKLGLKDVEFPLFILAILPLPVVPIARLTDQCMMNAITQVKVGLFV